jgi:molybdenum cofactor guanylyltransferase
VTPTAGIVLCGGQSSRMGEPKAALTISGESLLIRTVRTVAQVATPIVVAAAADQLLQFLPDDVNVVRDLEPARGPLAAFANALAAIPSDWSWVYLIGCDLPFLTVEFLRFLAERREGADAVVPNEEGRWHPLAALYRREVHFIAKRVLSSGGRRMLDLIDAITVEKVDADQLRRIAPDGRCLRNVNTPEEFAAVLRDLDWLNKLKPP